MEEVAKFDPAKMMEGVKDRIKATFVGLIPDEAWDAMVKKEVDSFFEERTVTFQKRTGYSYGGYNSGSSVTQDVSHSERMSPFKQLVWEYCTEATVKVLKEKFASEWFTNIYNESEPERQITEKMQLLVKDIVPFAINEFFTRVVYQQTSDLRNRLIR